MSTMRWFKLPLNYDVSLTPVTTFNVCALRPTTLQRGRFNKKQLLVVEKSRRIRYDTVSTLTLSCI
jgi:hypothetical protein